MLFVVSFLVYWPALHGEFIWDDILNIPGNPIIRSPDGLADIWAGGPQIFDYYPVTWTAWWVQWQMFRRATLGYHVVSIVLHAGAAGLLWRVLTRLRLPGAFVAALVFTVHPVNVESVAWITELKNTLSMFLLAATTALYLDSEEQSRSPLQRRALFCAAVIGFALTLLAKPAVVLFPFVLLGLAWWRRGSVGRDALWRAVPFFAVSIAIAVVTIFVHHARSMVGATVRTDGFAGRLATSAWCVWYYLYKLLWPADLAFIYPRWEVDPRRPLHWLPLAALVGVLVGLFLLRRRIGRGGLVALLAYIALLFPVLGFVNVYFMRYSFVADHWQYHAGFVVIAAVVATATKVLWRLAGEGRRRAAGVVGTVLAMAVCLVLAVHSWHEAHFYKDGMTLWAEAIRDNPTNAYLHNNYGAELLAAGRKDAAREYFRRAIELDPTPSEPYLGMGASYMQESPATALAWYERAVGKEGTAGHPRGFVGEALAALGRTDEALASFELALADRPVNPRYRGTAARLQMERGNPGRAVELYRDEIYEWPRYAENWYKLADALAAAKRPDEAREAVAEACRRAKGDHALINGFATQFLTSGRPELAEQAARAAICLQPDYGPAHVHLGRALEALNRPAEAEAAYAEALRVQPGFRDAAQGLFRLQDRASTRPASGPQPSTAATAVPTSAFSAPSSTMPAR